MLPLGKSLVDTSAVSGVSSLVLKLSSIAVGGATSVPIVITKIAVSHKVGVPLSHTT